MENEVTNRVMKPLEDMDVIDNFLFTELMADEENGLEVCRMILSCVLKREVGEIHFTPQKAVPGVSERLHGIRMDAYVTEKKNGTGEDISVYDIEPDKKSADRAGLPRRSRYYGDLIDVQLLNRGIDYDRLPGLVTIFILSYDPFEKNAMYYEAGSIIKTHPDIPYNDGVRRIYLYVDGELPGEADDGEKKLRNLLRYIGESTEANVIDDTTRKLNDIVAKTKRRKDIGVRYMKSWEIARDYIEQGLEQGREEGREEGLKEGRERAEKAERRAEVAEERVRELEALLAASQN